jgi:hypothetical protein
MYFHHHHTYHRTAEPNVISNYSSTPMSSALARYLKQQAADRLSVQQRGAAVREAEQQARSRAAAEAPRVLHQLEAEARGKVRSGLQYILV